MLPVSRTLRGTRAILLAGTALSGRVLGALVPAVSAATTPSLAFSTAAVALMAPIVFGIGGSVAWAGAGGGGGSGNSQVATAQAASRARRASTFGNGVGVGGTGGHNAYSGGGGGGGRAGLQWRCRRLCRRPWRCGRRGFQRDRRRRRDWVYWRRRGRCGRRQSDRRPDVANAANISGFGAAGVVQAPS